MGSPIKEIFPVDVDRNSAAVALVKISKLFASQGTCAIEIEVTEKIREGIVAMLEKLANEEPVAILSVDREYSTNEAAEFLRVSRPYLTKLLNQGELPFRQIGSHRRIEAKDLFAYKELKDKEKEEAFKRMARWTREIEHD